MNARLFRAVLTVVMAGALVAAGCDGSGSDTGAEGPYSSNEAALSADGLPPTCAMVPFGLAQPFNVVLDGNLVASGSEIGGRAAIGGNMNVTGYGVGMQLPKDASRRDLIVGGNLSFQNGAVPNGATVYGGSLTTASATFLAGPTQVPNAFPFGSTFTQLTALSNYLAGLPTNGTVSAGPTFKLTGTNPALNVFSISAAALGTATSLQISAPASSTVVVNVTGTNVNLHNFAIFFSGGASRERTLFNFPNALAISFSAIQIQGTVLAPKASVSFNNGQLDGQIFAHSLSGYGEPMWYPFTGCLPVPPVCPLGKTLCGEHCLDLQTDAANCGACGTHCAAGQSCVAGQCTAPCGPGLTKCGEHCLNLQTDPANCGACGAHCAAGQSCIAGQCTAPCGPGLTKCGEHCVNLQTDGANCGHCGQLCPAGQTCSAGVCVLPCPSHCLPGLVYCSGTCADLSSAESDCGACGHACAAGKVCLSGQCAPAQCIP